MLATIGKLFRCVILLSCSVALVMQFIITGSCTFLYKSSEEDGGTLDFGLYRLGINKECLDGSYTALGGHENDKLLFNARNCHVTSMIAGAIGMLLVLTECLKCKIICGKFLESIIFAIAWTNGLAVFIVFGMDGCGNYFDLNLVQEQLDNMTSAALSMERMDQNPNTDFTMGKEMREQVEGLEYETFNVTELVPAFVETIPFGTKCVWGQGASLNLIASLLYFGSGLLLCFTPKAVPIYGSDKEEDTQITGGTSLSLRESSGSSAWTSPTEGSGDGTTNAKIV